MIIKRSGNKYFLIALNMEWLIFGILSAVSFGFYNFFTKLASDKFSFSIVLMLTSGVAFLVAIITTIILKFNGSSLVFSKNYLTFPILAGLFTGFAEIFYILMFSKNAPLSIGNPLVVGGTVAVAVILGVLILREPINIFKIVGIILTIIGLIFLAKS